MDKKSRQALMITTALYIFGLSIFSGIYLVSATINSGTYERTDKKSTWLNISKKGGIYYKIPYTLEKTSTVQRFRTWSFSYSHKIYDSDYMWRNKGGSLTPLYDEDYPDYCYALDVNTWGDLCLVDDTSSYYRLQSEIWFDQGEDNDHHYWSGQKYGDIRTLYWYGSNNWDKAF